MQPQIKRAGSVQQPSNPASPPGTEPQWFLRLAHPRGIVAAMGPVTQILSAIEQGDPQAAGELLPLVYDEMRKLASQKLGQEKPGQTLPAPGLVPETYLRLVHHDAD